MSPELDQVWVTGLSVRRDDRAIYTHLIRSPSDPERSPRPKGGHKDRAPHRTLAKRPAAEIEELLLSGLEDGEPRTFNRLGVEIFDLTADVLFTTPGNTILWQLVAQGKIEHTLEAPILFRYRKGESSMEEQDQDQDQQNQEGEELLKMIGVEEEEEGEGREDTTGENAGSLLSLTEISKRTGIMYVTLKRYAVLHDSTDLAGLWEGEGRSKKYHPEAVEVFKRLKAESKKGRPRGGQKENPAPPNRAGVADPLPPTIPSSKKGKKPKRAAVKRPGKPGSSRHAPSPLPASSSPLATQEADRAMAAIERVQLMARYETVKSMVGQWVKEMERLEKVLGLGEAER